MRIAAGILMIIVGMVLAFYLGGSSLWFDVSAVGVIGVRDLLFPIFMTIYAVFLVIGGAYCLKRKHWRVCLSSALVLLPVPIFAMIAFVYTVGEGSHPGIIELAFFMLWEIGGILPIIFVSLRRREWQKAQA